MHYIINPLKIKKTEAFKLLKSLLDKNPDIHTWKENVSYSIENDTIELTNRVIQMLSQGTNEPTKYYVVSQFALFENEKSRILPVESAFSFPEEQLIAYHDIKSMLVKIQSRHLLKKNQSSFLNAMNHEYRYSAMVDHLGVEILINEVHPSDRSGCVYVESIILMKKMPGIELFSFIDAFYPTSTINVSSSMRMRLMIEILRAFQHQVYQYNLYHGDLKPENMVIDLGIEDGVIPTRLEDQHVRQTKVNIIDYAGSQRFGDDIEHPTYSPGFVSPEILHIREDKKYMQLDNGRKAFPAVWNEKTDMFSLGKIIGLLWYWPPENELPSNKTQYDAIVENIHHTYFSNEPSWFTVQCLSAILLVVKETTAKHQEMRLSLDDAIANTEDLIDQYFRPNTPSLFEISATSTPTPPPPPPLYAPFYKAEAVVEGDGDWSDEGEDNQWDKIASLPFKSKLDRESAASPDLGRGVSHGNIAPIASLKEASKKTLITTVNSSFELAVPKKPLFLSTNKGGSMFFQPASSVDRQKSEPLKALGFN